MSYLKLPMVSSVVTVDIPNMLGVFINNTVIRSITYCNAAHRILWCFSWIILVSQRYILKELPIHSRRDLIKSGGIPASSSGKQAQILNECAE